MEQDQCEDLYNEMALEDGTDANVDVNVEADVEDGTNTEAEAEDSNAEAEDSDAEDETRCMQESVCIVSKQPNCPFCQEINDCSQLEGYEYYCSQGETVCYICGINALTFEGYEGFEPGEDNVKKHPFTIHNRHFRYIREYKAIEFGIDQIDLPAGIGQIIIEYVTYMEPPKPWKYRRFGDKSSLKTLKHEIATMGGIPVHH